jgi:hypothetical protein
LSSSQTLSGGVGTILIGTLEITISPLSQADEIKLDKKLRKAAESAAGDHYSRCKRELDAARDNPGDRLEMVREIVRRADRREKLGEPAFFEYRTGPEGTAQEVFARGKKSTDGLKLDALQAIITDENVDEVSAQLFEILENADPKATP